MLFDEDDDEALQQALAMSMMEAEQFDQEHQGVERDILAGKNVHS